MYSNLAFRSLTEAQRGMELLRRRRIAAFLTRRTAAGGCVYGIRVPERDSEVARAVLLNAGIPFTGGTEK